MGYGKALPRLDGDIHRKRWELFYIEHLPVTLF